MHFLTGTDPKYPTYVAVMGTIFDVSGNSSYAPKGSYCGNNPIPFEATRQATLSSVKVSVSADLKCCYIYSFCWQRRFTCSGSIIIKTRRLRARVGGPTGEGKGRAERLAHLLQQAIQYCGQGTAIDNQILHARRSIPRPISVPLIILLHLWVLCMVPSPLPNQPRLLTTIQPCLVLHPLKWVVTHRRTCSMQGLRRSPGQT